MEEKMYSFSLAKIMILSLVPNQLSYYSSYSCYSCRLTVRENGKQRVCIAGLMETEVKNISSLIHVSILSFHEIYQSVIRKLLVLVIGNCMF